MANFSDSPTIAYFSMEVGLEAHMPTYSGGLGVLAGDTLRGAADMGVPMVGVTLLHRKGYFRQQLDERGQQTERPWTWRPEKFLELLPASISVAIEGRPVWIRAWRYLVRGINGSSVPVYFLDTLLEQNHPADQALTDCLYGGDAHYRLCQEAVLGLGGVAMLRALGHDHIQTYHMNEGHSALLTLGLLVELTQGGLPPGAAAGVHEAIRQHCVFTTHTPVPAGHDQFPGDLVRHVLGADRTGALHAVGYPLNGALNMTQLALFFAHYVNGVAMRHGEVSRDMFPSYPINSITNGVHALSWTCEAFQRLFNQHIPEWRHDNLYLRYAISIPLSEIQEAHAEAKRALCAEVERRTSVRLDPAALTLGFARRATPYKRADLFFADLDRLRRIAREVGPLQVVYSGKAHPNDEGGKALIRRIFEASANLNPDIRVVYLPEYDMALGKLIAAGVDIWLNTPLKPQEASGTSGMKAALNGVPSLSILDGWWVEGHLEGITGWSIDDPARGPDCQERQVQTLYDKLEGEIVPLFYRRPDAFAAMMRWCIALNGSYFNAQRMVGQYVQNAYRATKPTDGRLPPAEHAAGNRPPNSPQEALAGLAAASAYPRPAREPEVVL